MGIVQTASLGVGVFGAGLALYQLYKRRESEKREKKLEKQIEEKEEIQSLAEKTKKLRNHLKDLHRYLSNPMEHKDMRISLQTLSRDVLSYHHTTGNSAEVIVDEITKGIGDQKKVLQTTDEMLESYENGELVFINLKIKDEQGITLQNHFYDVDQVFWPILQSYKVINDINREYGEMLERFDSELEADVKEILEDIVHESHNQLVENQDGVSFNPEDYSTTEELTDDIYRTFLLPKEVEERLPELKDLAKRMKETQTSLAVAAS